MAKIETIARPIEGFEWLGKYAPVHISTLHTKDNGEQINYRGGPEKGNYHKDIKGEPFRDNLKVTKLPYNPDHPDFVKDYWASPKKLIIEGNDHLVNPYIEKMESNPMKRINDANIDYKVLIGQNSNAAAREMIEGAGLEFKLPEYEDGTKVIAPQWGAKIERTWIDKTRVGEKAWAFYDKLEEKVNELNKKYNEKINQVKKDIAEKMGIEMKELDKKLEEALKLLESSSLASKLAAGTGGDTKLFPKLSICMPFTDTYKADIKDSFNNIKKSLLKTINNLLTEKKDKKEELEKELNEKLNKLQKELDERIEKEREDTEDKLRDGNEKYQKELNEIVPNIKDKYKIKMQSLSDSEKEITKIKKEKNNNDLKYDLDEIYSKYDKNLLDYKSLLSKFESALYKDIERSKEYYASNVDLNKKYSEIHEEEKYELGNKINDLCNKYIENTLFYNLCISHKHLVEADSDFQTTKSSVFSIINAAMTKEGIRRNEELYKNKLDNFMESFKDYSPTLNIIEKMKELVKNILEGSKEISESVSSSYRYKVAQEHKPTMVSLDEKVKAAREKTKSVYDEHLVGLYKEEEEKYIAYYKKAIDNFIDTYSKKDAMSSLDAEFNTFESDAHNLLNSVYGLPSSHNEL